MGQSGVFPGDANANGVVDQYDIPFIGYAFGETGAARIQEEDFAEQAIAEDWENAFPDGLNYIHADADGNGAVTMFDFFSWNLHYGEQNGTITDLELPETGPLTNSSVSWNNEQVISPLTGGQTIAVPLDFIFPPTQNVNGLAFRVRYESEYFAGASLDLNNNWLVADGDGISLQKNWTGSFEVGVTRFGNNPVPGGGSGGTFNLIIIDDMIALLETAPDTVTTWLVIEEVLAVDDNFEAIPIVVDSLEIKLYSPGTVSSTVPLKDETNIKVFPNPTSSIFTLESSLPYDRLVVLDALGREVYREENDDRLTTKTLDLQLNTGCYFLKVESENSTSCTKLIIE